MFLNIQEYWMNQADFTPIKWASPLYEMGNCCLMFLQPSFGFVRTGKTKEGHLDPCGKTKEIQATTSNLNGYPPVSSNVAFLKSAEIVWWISHQHLHQGFSSKLQLITRDQRVDSPANTSNDGDREGSNRKNMGKDRVNWANTKQQQWGCFKTLYHKGWWLVQSFEPILVSTVCGTIQNLTPTSSIKIKVNQHIFEQQQQQQKQQQRLTGMFNHSQQKWNPGRWDDPSWSGTAAVPEMAPIEGLDSFTSKGPRHLQVPCCWDRPPVF